MIESMIFCVFLIILYISIQESLSSNTSSFNDIDIISKCSRINERINDELLEFEYILFIMLHNKSLNNDEDIIQVIRDWWIYIDEMIDIDSY